jgi:hypothetical protein
LRNAEEFGCATRAGMMLRYALQPALQTIADGRLNGRMNALFLKLVKSDGIHVRGKRCVQNGRPALLEGFNFNKASELNKVFPVYCLGHIDAATGNMQVDIPAFIPARTLVPAPGATHFRIVSIAASLGFNERPSVRYIQETERFAIDQQTLPALRLVHTPATEAGQFLFLTLGVIFYTLPESIPADLLSKRKRMRLGNGDALVAYTGAMAILRATVATGTRTVATELHQE